MNRKKSKEGDIWDSIKNEFVDSVGFSIRKRTQKVLNFCFVLVKNFVIFCCMLDENNKNYEKPWIFLFRCVINNCFGKSRFHSSFPAVLQIQGIRFKERLKGQRITIFFFFVFFVSVNVFEEPSYSIS